MFVPSLKYADRFGGLVCIFIKPPALTRYSKLLRPLVDGWELSS